MIEFGHVDQLKVIALLVRQAGGEVTIPLQEVADPQLGLSLWGRRSADGDSMILSTRQRRFDELPPQPKEEPNERP